MQYTTHTTTMQYTTHTTLPTHYPRTYLYIAANYRAKFLYFNTQVYVAIYITNTLSTHWILRFNAPLHNRPLL